MSVERLERVMWRLRKRNPGKSIVTGRELRIAIMYECGTDPVTLKNNRKALRELGWIKPHKRSLIELTNNDLTGDDI